MLLLLIRHALTDHVGHKLSGWTSGVTLSERGREQAEQLAARLKPVKVDAIYCSPLERAAETAKVVARGRGVRIRQRDEIGEVHYGDLEGRSLRSLAKGKLWNRLRAWPSDVRFPGGESLRETQARAVAAVEDIRAAHPKGTVAVFSHGDWIRMVMAHYLGVHIDLYRRIGVDPASVNIIDFFAHGPYVRALNDTGDLAGLSAPRGGAR
ncbi:MAG TPA: MSMEG_4193 family putative phosphomutase [Actinomycetota bacterium]